MSLTDFTDDIEPLVTNRAALRRKAKTADIERENRRLTLLEMLKQKPSRDFFWWLLEQYGPTRSPLSFARGAVDVHSTMVGVGMANAGNILLAEITAAAPDQYMTMLAEEQERQELRNRPNG